MSEQDDGTEAGRDYGTLLALMRSRRSIRHFADRQVGRENLERLIEAARWAPSNHNRQPWRFLVFDDRQTIQRLVAGVRQGVAERLRRLPSVAAPYAAELTEHANVFGRAPVLIVALHQRPVNIGRRVLDGLAHPALVSGEPLSVAMAVQNLLLAAHALGLGACVLTAPLLAQDRLALVLPLPAGFDLTCFVALGYPDESPAVPRRKGLDMIVGFCEPLPLGVHDEDRPGDP